MDTQVHKAQSSPNRFNQKRSLTRYTANKLSKNIRQRENFESRKRKCIHHIQRNSNKAISIFFNRNLAGQETVR